MRKRKMVLAIVAAAMICIGATATKTTGAETEAAANQDVPRVVSIGGSITETLYALGLEKRIIAVDTTSVFPPEALREKPNVGYMRALSAEGVLALEPGLIIAVEGAGPPDAMNVIRSASIPMVTVPDKPTPNGVIDKIRAIAGAMNESGRGEKLVAKVAEEFTELKQFTSGLDQRARVLFVLSLRGGRPVVAGSDTAAEGILVLAGAENAIKGFSGYKPVTDEAIIAAAPDVILMMSRPEHRVPAEQLLAYPALRTTPAGQNKRVIIMSGQYLIGFGPRTARAAGDLAAAIYHAADTRKSGVEPNGASN